MAVYEYLCMSCEHLFEDRVRRHLFGERLVRQDEAVPQCVACERLPFDGAYKADVRLRYLTLDLRLACATVKLPDAAGEGAR